MDLINLNGICKNYKKFEALKNVDFTIREGDFVSIVGESGSGKSTLLNIIGLISTPSSGKYEFLGEELNLKKDSVLSEKRCNDISYIRQDFALINHFSVKNNLMLKLDFLNKKMKKSEKITLIKEALDKVNLGDKLNQKVKNLSGGEKQRVAIARALLNKPKILLADEPTGSLDSMTGKTIIEEFIKIHNEGITIVLVTHDMEIAKRGEKIIRIEKGEIVTSED